MSSFEERAQAAASAGDGLLDDQKDIEDYAGKRRRHEYRGWITIYWVMLGSAIAVWLVWTWNLFAPEDWRWLNCEDLNTAFKMTVGALGALLYGRAEGKAKTK